MSSGAIGAAMVRRKGVTYQARGGEEIRRAHSTSVNYTAEHLDLLLIDPERDVTGRLVAGAPGAVLVPGECRVQEKSQRHRRGQGGRTGRSRSHRNWPRRAAQCRRCCRRSRRCRCRRCRCRCRCQVLHAHQ